jgi:hypothetical protein
VLKRPKLVLARHETSKSSAKAPTFLVHGFVISNTMTSIDLRIGASTSASVILGADTDGHVR